MPTLPKTLAGAPPTAVPNDHDSPMSGDQADLLCALCEDTGEPFDAGLTPRQALQRIDDLRQIMKVDKNL